MPEPVVDLVCGIDPGGSGTTGAVLCSGWAPGRAGQWPPYLPSNVDVVACSDSWHEATGHIESVVGPRICVGIEDTPSTQAFNVLTVKQIGALTYAAHRAGATKVVLAQAQAIRYWLFGSRPPKGQGDRLVDQKLLALYGGKDKAVGGRNCPSCKGKGWVGRNHTACEGCGGYRRTPRGPLWSLWKPRSNQHLRAALAVALYAYHAVGLRGGRKT